MGDNLIESMVDGFHIMPISKERGEMGESEKRKKGGGTLLESQTLPFIRYRIDRRANCEVNIFFFVTFPWYLNRIIMLMLNSPFPLRSLSFSFLFLLSFSKASCTWAYALVAPRERHWQQFKPSPHWPS